MKKLSYPLVEKILAADAADASEGFKILVTSIHKSVEEDDYEQGANPETTQNILDESNVGTYGSFQAMMDALEQKYGFPGKDEGWVAFEPGRLTVNRSENADGYPLSSKEQEQFKAGKIKGYLADFDIYLELVKAQEPSVEEMVKLFGIEAY
jgi:hypothetical protein